MAAQDVYMNPSAHSLFKRCVTCPSEPPKCPSCGPDASCSLLARSCDTCASTKCVRIGSLPGQLQSRHSKPIGPIVGGVMGAIASCAILSFFIYWFCVRKKRQPVKRWETPEKRDQSTLYRGDRQSTRSAHSIASTVLTRASNVIQIAYIPGITVRSPPESPGLLAPPMPSFPGGSGNSSTVSSPQVEQHYFMPGDLRDSTWSDASSVDPRISLSPSLATRASVATTIYRTDAIVPPVPAQQAFRAQANMVSVKNIPGSGSGSSSTSRNRTPPVPQVPKMGMGSSSIVARTVTARPIEVKKSKVPTLGNLAKEAAKKNKAVGGSEKSSPVFSDEKEVVSPGVIVSESPTLPIIKPKDSFASFETIYSSGISAIMPSEGPLGSKSSANGNGNTDSAALNAMIEEAVNRAARDPQHMQFNNTTTRPDLKRQDSSPFSDSNEVKENLL